MFFLPSLWIIWRKLTKVFLIQNIIIIPFLKGSLNQCPQARTVFCRARLLRQLRRQVGNFFFWQKFVVAGVLGLLSELLPQPVGLSHAGNCLLPGFFGTGV